MVWRDNWEKPSTWSDEAWERHLDIQFMLHTRMEESYRGEALGSRVENDLACSIGGGLLLSIGASVLLGMVSLFGNKTVPTPNELQSGPITSVQTSEDNSGLIGKSRYNAQFGHTLTGLSDSNGHLSYIRYENNLGVHDIITIYNPLFSDFRDELLSG